MRIVLVILAISISLLSCTSSKKEIPYTKKPFSTDFYHHTVKKLTDVIVYDIFSPPVASRIYVYPNIAAYEVLAKNDENYKSLAGQLQGLKPIPSPSSKKIDYEIAAIRAFMVVGKQLIFSENKVDEYEEELKLKYNELDIPDYIITNSFEYGDQVAAHTLAWADLDNYKQTRTFPKYTIQEEEETWQPTPPDYMEGIEPSWNKIRPLIIDSAAQFPPELPTEFDMSKNSIFYKELLEVYTTVNDLTKEQEEIAQFWDCNPFVSHHKGHAMFATKKITPGGHWIGITNIATRKANSSFIETVNAYTRVSVSLFDAFISCWDEKWRSVLVRPETLINKHIDEDWEPLLQTPPFPEYTSGHSVISAAASLALTDLYGKEFNYMDSTELEYGLKPRAFKSFIEASEEAAISRLYGGIHYMPAINNGVKQGRKVGNYIINNLETKIEK